MSSDLSKDVSRMFLGIGNMDERTMIIIAVSIIAVFWSGLIVNYATPSFLSFFQYSIVKIILFSLIIWLAMDPKNYIWMVILTIVVFSTLYVAGEKSIMSSCHCGEGFRTNSVEHCKTCGKTNQMNQMNIANANANANVRVGDINCGSSMDTVYARDYSVTGIHDPITECASTVSQEPSNQSSDQVSGQVLPLSQHLQLPLNKPKQETAQNNTNQQTNQDVGPNEQNQSSENKNVMGINEMDDEMSMLSIQPC
ncbi:MAG: hypothetical protein Dasosvirus7_5 [Dasosvirus sp.]|uniref:Transmembrane protein n=1 Tax=Dasosvirus sp. TaxID=2487764 RepID=A0A3G4ZRN1_9VIRU|nr:MAG: hypothetical protein Dasosvirus7_5 [Dasosvirus sp.]